MSLIDTFLVIGACGSGKTWVMKQLISQYNLNKKGKINKFVFQTDGKLSILGNYNGSTFEGSDKLSMAIMSDCDKMKQVQKKHQMTIICEGDRFTNKTFISKFDPFIIKITDNGEEGRKKRGSNQTERHLKSINTRVRNTKCDIELKNSSLALSFLTSKLQQHEKS